MNWDQEFDVVVVGSGSGAMVAAIVAHDHGQQVVVLEKADKYGGTSATSGHGVWIPCNRYAKAADDYDDSFAEASLYIKDVTPLDKVPEALIDRYVEQGPQMIDYLYNKTHLEFVNHPTFPDYFSFAKALTFLVKLAIFLLRSSISALVGTLMLCKAFSI